LEEDPKIFLKKFYAIGSIVRR